MPKRPNESPDSLQGQVEAWDRATLPCGHFVNYNTDFGMPDAYAASAMGGSEEAGQHAGQWMSMNIEETMAVLTRCSFDEAHRQPIFMLGGIPALAELIQVCLFIFFTIFFLISVCKIKVIFVERHTISYLVIFFLT